MLELSAREKKDGRSRGYYWELESKWYQGKDRYLQRYVTPKFYIICSDHIPQFSHACQISHSHKAILINHHYYYYYCHQYSSSWSCRGIWSWRALCGGTCSCSSSSENGGSNQDPLHHNLSHGSHGLARRGIYIYIKLFER